MKQNSKNAKIFCLVHKMDLIPEEQRDPVFLQRERELKRLAQPLGLDVTCFKTSIWDETLYRAWSMIVHSLIPNRESLASQLERLCSVCQADEVVLFERATFLVISHAVCKEHADVHRFEKVSNIIKQFKLSCSKTQAQFATLQVRNAHYSALIEGFTSTTYAMVIVSDKDIQPATTLINIEASRATFEALINNLNNPPPAAPSLGSLGGPPLPGFAGPGHGQYASLRCRRCRYGFSLPDRRQSHAHERPPRRWVSGRYYPGRQKARTLSCLPSQLRTQTLQVFLSVHTARYRLNGRCHVNRYAIGHGPQLLQGLQLLQFRWRPLHILVQK